MKWSSGLLWLSDHCCWGLWASLGSVLGNSLHAAFRWAFRCFQRRCGQYYGTHCDITAIVGCWFFFQLSSQPLALGTGRGDLTGRHSSTTSAHPKCRNLPLHLPPEPCVCFTEEDDGSSPSLRGCALHPQSILCLPPLGTLHAAQLTGWCWSLERLCGLKHPLLLLLSLPFFLPHL